MIDKYRPGAAEVSEEEEIARVVPIIEGIHAAKPTAVGGDENHRQTDRITLSVDTRRAAVAEAAVAAGAHAVNDVSGGTSDPGMLAAVARAGVPLFMMHMRWVHLLGTPEGCLLLFFSSDVSTERCRAVYYVETADSATSIRARSPLARGVCLTLFSFRAAASFRWPVQPCTGARPAFSRPNLPRPLMPVVLVTPYFSRGLPSVMFLCRNVFVPTVAVPRKR